MNLCKFDQLVDNDLYWGHNDINKFANFSFVQDHNGLVMLTFKIYFSPTIGTYFAVVFEAKPDVKFQGHNLTWDNFHT